MQLSLALKGALVRSSCAGKRLTCCALCVPALGERTPPRACRTSGLSRETQARTQPAAHLLKPLADGGQQAADGAEQQAKRLGAALRIAARTLREARLAACARRARSCRACSRPHQCRAGGHAVEVVHSKQRAANEADHLVVAEQRVSDTHAQHAAAKQACPTHPRQLRVLKAFDALATCRARVITKSHVSRSSCGKCGRLRAPA